MWLLAACVTRGVDVPDIPSRASVTPSVVRVFDADALRRLPATDAFVLVECVKDPDDTYATFTGVRLVDLLAAAGVDVAAPGPTQVTAYAPPLTT